MTKLFHHRAVAFFALLALSLLVPVSNTLAQLDPTFGTNGVATADTGVNDTPLASYVLPDGKILVVSHRDLESSSSSYKISFLRFNSNGTLDSGYGTGGVRELTIPYPTGSGNILGVTRQPDGKIVLVGADSFFAGIVTRFNEDGTLDTGFGVNGVRQPPIPVSFRYSVGGVAVQSDGRIVVAGHTEVGEGGYRLFLARYLSDGTPDTTYGPSGTGLVIHSTVSLATRNAAEFIALQSTGKLIVGNHAASGAEIRRYNTDGGIDATFNPISLPGDTPTNNFFAATIQADDKILTGTQYSYNDSLFRSNFDVLVSRFNADGTIDGGFGAGGQRSFDVANYQPDTPIGLHVASDGSVLVAVNTFVQANRSVYRSGWLGLARLTSTGTLTGKFLSASTNGNRRVITSVLPDGKVLFTSRAPGSDVMLVKTVGIPTVTYKMRAIPFDFSNGWSRPAYYRATSRTWSMFPTSSTYFFGLSDDIPVASDYVGNFSADMAVFRPSDGTWYIAKSRDNASQNFIAVRWGAAGDIPVPNDYDGDGKSDVAVFRPSEGNWYIRNSSDESYTIALGV